MRKLLFVLMSFLVVVGLAACGDDEESNTKGNDNSNTESIKEENTESNNTDENNDLTIGISLPAATHGWMGALIDHAEQQAKEIKESEGVDYVITNAADPNSQANDVDDLISQDVDVIVMLPIESAALSPVGEKIKEAGIPLVVVDRELENDAATIVVKGDNEGIGINAGQYFIEQLNGEGKIVEIEGPPSSVTDQRGSGFKEAIEKEDNMEIIATQSGDFSTEKSLEVMQNILQSHTQIDAVFTQDDEMALGVIQAIKEAGRDDIQFVTGAGGTKSVFEHIQEDGLISATFLYSPTMVRDGIEIAAALAQGKETEETMLVKEATQVTKDNVDEYYDSDSKY